MHADSLIIISTALQGWFEMWKLKKFDKKMRTNSCVH